MKKRLFCRIFLLPALLITVQFSWATEDPLIRETRLLAEQGDPEAQFSLGLLYDTSDQLLHNPEKAVFWFRKAAEQGLAGACLYLGMKYEFGSGTGQNIEKALYWYRQAALRGWGQAAFMLGSLYLSMAPPDPVRGCSWLGIAAEQNFPGAARSVTAQCSRLEQDLVGRIEKKTRELRKQIAP
jgi:TPR repeat protein